jgi:glycine dehydrogenase subunit 1
MAYVTNSEQDVREMLSVIGVDDFEQLVATIPSELRFKGKLNIGDPQSEYEVSCLLEKLAGKNKSGISFMGGGSYDHYIPAVIDTIIGRSEFYTAYTPYQPEVSQGTLQSIYEFQSMICELTAMDVTNASMYEGGSALAEAVLMACAHTRRNKVLVAGSLNPRFMEILKTYSRHNEIELVEIPLNDFAVDTGWLKTNLGDDVAAVIIQHPNYFGCLEEVFEIGEMLREKKALYIAYYDPLSLGLIAPPGEYGADLAIGEGQVLGNRQNFGGPYVGLFSGTMELVRKMPGRIVGMTKDLDGKDGFVLTLQTREQHIRREKATSNICTNSGLMALAATVYLALIGRDGLKQIGDLCVQNSHYLADKLSALPGVTMLSKRPFFKEFAVELPVPSTLVIARMQEEGFLAGISLEKSGRKNGLLIAVTEKRNKEQMDLFVDKLAKGIK